MILVHLGFYRISERHERSEQVLRQQAEYGHSESGLVGSEVAVTKGVERPKSFLEDVLGWGGVCTQVISRFQVPNIGGE